MTTLSALLVLGQAALLGASWWIARALRDGERPSPWLLGPAMALALLGSVPELGSALAGHSSAFADAAGLGGLGTLVVSEMGFGAVAGHRTVIAARRRSALRTEAIGRLDAGDAAFAGGGYDVARARFQEVVTAAQGAGDDELIRVALTRVAWLDYVCARHRDARSAISWAAGGAVDDAVGSELLLLAACLALAGGRLDIARPAIEDAGRLAVAAHDASQQALAKIALGCEHYLEGWTDSGRSFIKEHAEVNLQTFDRGLAGVLLVALASLAWERGSAEDARAVAAVAAPLVEGNATLAPLAAHAGAPAASPWLDKPARELARLMAPLGVGGAGGAASSAAGSASAAAPTARL